jgi:hypothetical protein
MLDTVLWWVGLSAIAALATALLVVMVSLMYAGLMVLIIGRGLKY